MSSTVYELKSLPQKASDVAIYFHNTLNLNFQFVKNSNLGYSLMFFAYYKIKNDF